MKTLTFIAISLLAGAIAGIIFSLINQVVVEPFIERAVALENDRATMHGDMIPPVQFDSYRIWQKDGSIVAGAVLGMSYCALLGVVFAYSRNSLPGKRDISKALVLAGIMWVVIYFVVAVKYPANPPAVGNPDTIYLRMSLYVVMLMISGVSALGLAVLSKKVTGKAKRMAIPVIYGGIIAAAFVALPSNPDAVTAPMDLVAGFRLASGATMALFWILMGAILGVLWDLTKPHETAKLKAARA